MRLTELEPRFRRYETRADGEWKITVDNLSEAQGVSFLCPVCFAKNGGAIGTHHVEVTFSGRSVLDHQGSQDDEEKPVRWDVSGTGFEDLTTHPSVLCIGGCAWHGFITNGEVT